MVRFYKEDGTDWVANFKPGYNNFNKIYDSYPHQNLLVVVAGGLLYVMSPENEKQLTSFGDYIDTIFETKDGKIVCHDFTGFFCFDCISGEYWQSERISLDGFKDLIIEGNIISGLSYDSSDSKNDWKEFSLNLVTKEIKGGSYPE